MAETETLTGAVRRALSDLADAATRGAAGRAMPSGEFADEMKAINTAYAAGLAAVTALESGSLAQIAPAESGHRPVRLPGAASGAAGREQHV